MTTPSATHDRLSAFDAKLAEVGMVGQWKFEELLRQAIGGPATAGVPHKWPWETVAALLDESCQVLDETTTVRRTLAFTNPGLASGTTHALLGAVQMVLPGEVEWTHSHPIAALRFVIEGGQGLSTVVNGEPLPMRRHDLILTPPWALHDHHNVGDRPGIWLDVLDLPIIAGLRQISYHVPNTQSQEHRMAARTDSDSRPSFLRPATCASSAMEAPLRFAWSDVEHELERQSATGPIDPCEGLMLEYFNPVTGQSVLPTLSCNVQMLPAAFVGRSQRQTASKLCYVMEGRGKTTIEGHPDIEWQERDVFVLPNWVWHEHVNRSGSERALIFTVSESALLRSIGIDRKESRGS